MATLEERLHRLERENRRWKYTAAATFMVIAALVVMGQSASRRVADVVEAEKFVLRDISGGIRGALHITPEGEPSLALLSKNGQAQLTVSRFGPMLRLYDKNEKERAAIHVIGLDEDDQSPVLELFDPNRGQRASISVDNDMTSLYLYDKDKRGAISLTTGGLGKSKNQSLTIWNNEGEIRTTLSGSPSLSLYHKDEKLLALGTIDLGMTPSGRQRYESSLILFDKDRRIIWKAP